ncbi:hypothetical protein [Skermanella pratensis]|nr:hypothetical protein [Skermanella pratensis]
MSDIISYFIDADNARKTRFTFKQRCGCPFSAATGTHPFSN